MIQVVVVVVVVVVAVVVVVVVVVMPHWQSVTIIARMAISPSQVHAEGC